MRDWREVALGDQLRLRVPTEVAPSDDHAVDSDAMVLSGPGVTVVVDRGPYADPLTSYRERPGRCEREETIGGRRARIVSFERDEGGHYVAAHFPRPEQPEAAEALTVAVETTPELSQEVGDSILRSITFP